MQQIKCIDGSCRLCGKVGRLQRSHIYPRFTIKRLIADCPTPWVRFANKPNLAVQDGPTDYLLCFQCETRFNVYGETYFAKYIDARKWNGTLRPFTISEPILYYTASVIWRSVCWNIPATERFDVFIHRKGMELLLARYLLCRETFLNYPDCKCFFLIPPVMQGSQFPPRANSFLRASVSPIIGASGGIAYSGFLANGMLVILLSSVDGTALPRWPIESELILGNVIRPGVLPDDKHFWKIIDLSSRLPIISDKQDALNKQRMTNIPAARLMKSFTYNAILDDAKNENERMLAIDERAWS